MVRKRTFFNWLKINVLSFGVAVMLVFLLVRLFPQQMTALAARWRGLILATHPGLEHPSKYETAIAAFGGMLLYNLVAILINYFAGLILLSPVLSFVYGAFYSVFVFTAFLIQGALSSVGGIILGCIEITYLMITASFASTLGTEIFGIEPQLKRYLSEAWKEEFHRPPKPVRGWQEVHRERRNSLMAFGIVVGALLILGAWFEVAIWR